MPNQDRPNGPRSRIAGNILIALTGLMLIGSAIAKLAHVPKVAAELGAMGFDSHKLLVIGILEIFCAVLFLFTSTRPLGLLLVSSYMGGAIATHLQHSLPVAQPAFVLALMWLGVWLRHPQVFRSLRLAEKADLDAYSSREETLKRAS